jgi:hypothetical protein
LESKESKGIEKSKRIQTIKKNIEGEKNIFVKKAKPFLAFRVFRFLRYRT